MSKTPESTYGQCVQSQRKPKDIVSNTQKGPKDSVSNTQKGPKGNESNTRWIVCLTQHKGPNDSVINTQKGKCIQHQMIPMDSVSNILEGP